MKLFCLFALASLVAAQTIGETLEANTFDTVVCQGSSLTISVPESWASDFVVAGIVVNSLDTASEWGVTSSNMDLEMSSPASSSTRKTLFTSETPLTPWFVECANGTEVCQEHSSDNDSYCDHPHTRILVTISPVPNNRNFSWDFCGTRAACGIPTVVSPPPNFYGCEAQAWVTRIQGADSRMLEHISELVKTKAFEWTDPPTYGFSGDFSGVSWLNTANNTVLRLWAGDARVQAYFGCPPRYGRMDDRNSYSTAITLACSQLASERCYQTSMAWTPWGDRTTLNYCASNSSMVDLFTLPYEFQRPSPQNACRSDARNSMFNGDAKPMVSMLSTFDTKASLSVADTEHGWVWPMSATFVWPVAFEGFTMRLLIPPVNTYHIGGNNNTNPAVDPTPAWHLYAYIGGGAAGAVLVAVGGVLLLKKKSPAKADSKDGSAAASDSKATRVRDYGRGELLDALRKRGFSTAVIKVFRENKITGKNFVSLTEKDLMDMEISDADTRFKILTTRDEMVAKV